MLKGDVKISPPGRLPHFSGEMMPLVFTQRRYGESSASKSVPRAVRQVTRSACRARSIEALAERVHRQEIRAHAFEHDLPVDVDHVAVADVVRVDHGGHLDARAEFAGLGDARQKIDYLRVREIVEDDLRHAVSGRAA